MEIAVIFLTSLLVGFSGALMPGPLTIASLGEGARRGFWMGPLLVLGHAFAELAIVAALLIGLGSFLSQPLWAGVVGVLGGAFLLWMGYDLMASALKGRVSLSDPGAPSGIARFGPVPGGILASVSNPYWFLWWATVGAGYVAFALQWGPWGLAAFFVGHVLADLIWNSLISLAAHRGRALLRDAVYRSVLGACGVALAGLSVYFLVSGVGFLAKVA